MEEEIITPKEEVFDYEKLRYILNKDGYVCHASLGGLIVCDLGECTEYTGEIPKGYKTIQEWYDEEIEKLNAWKIVEGNLVYDKNKYNEIQKRCEIEAEENAPATHGWVNGRINKTSNVVKSELSNVASDSELLLINDSGDFEIPYLQVSSRGKLKEATGSNIHLSDSRGADLIDFKLYGKSTQETRSGRNLFNYEDVKSVINGESADDKGWITMTYDNSTGTSSHYSNWWTSKVQTLKPSTQYLIITEIKEVSGAGTLSVVSSHSACQFGNGKSYKFTDVSSNSIHSVILTTRADFTNTSYMLRTFATFNAGQSGSITFRISVLEDTSITTDNFEYEAYGLMPSPDYPSEIKSVGYENLLQTNLTSQTINGVNITVNQDKSVTLNGTVTAGFNIVWKSDTFTLLKGTYSIGLITTTNDFNLYLMGSSGNTILMQPATKKFATLTLENDTTYTSLRSWVTSGRTFNNATFYPMILKGTQQHSYIPYGKYGIEVETIGKNKLNPNVQTQTVNGITITNNNDGSFTATGTSTSNLAIVLTKDKMKLEKGKTYTNSIEILNGSLDGGSITVTVKDTNNKTTYNYMNLWTNVLSNTKTPTEDLTIDAYGFYVGSADKSFNVTFRVQLEENDKKTSWEEYKITPTLIQNDYPLMSNKDETIRDYVYLQNGNLYLKKQINEIILNDQENWILSGYSNDEILSVYNELLLSGLIKENTPVMSNYFNYVPNVSYSTITPYISINNHTLRLGIPKVIAGSIEELKNWLSNNNVKVVFEMNQPQDILIAENVDSLITYKNVTNISTNDELQPNMGVTYYADIDENIPVNIKISNKNLLDNKAVTTTENGIKFTVNKDKTITLNGTATADTELFIDGSLTNTEMLFLIKYDLQYIKSGLAENVSLNLYKYDGTDRILIDSGSNGIINITESTIVTGASLFIASGTSFKKLKLSPMIEISDVETEYLEHNEVLKTGSFTSDNYTLIYENEPKTYEPTTIIMIDEFADIEANYFNGKIIEMQQAEIEVLGDEIKTSVTSIEEAIGTIEEAINVINTTMLTQTADQFEMLFKQTGIKELVDTIDNLAKSNNATLIEQEQWIRFKNGNIELGKSDSQVKLLLSNDRISFMTGGNESAYISNNQLYITDSTILNKLQVGHWETKEDEDGNLNTRWIGGVI